MSWDNDGWKLFLATTVEIATGRRHDWRNSYLLYPYDPADEQEALIRVQNAPANIPSAEITTEVLSWGGYMADFLANQGFLRRSVRNETERERLQQSLVARLPQILAESTRKALEGKPQSHIAFIVRTGAIFPFATISQTLAACEQRDIRSTLAVLGPGRVADQGRSFALLSGDPHPGYPALIVSLNRDN